ncbi:MAG: hypothetical protein KKE11_00350 [Gammaproteobacteria bacterium]|nr:hypothetical protein [Gammaproteobacteria bacterium]
MPVVIAINISYASEGTCVPKGDGWDELFHGGTTTFIQTTPEDNEQDGVMLLRKEGSGSCMVGCMDTYCFKDMQPDLTSACAPGERLTNKDT